MRKTNKSKFRDLLRTEKMVTAAGIYDGLSAKAAEQAGFEALYMTGNGSMASMLGVPDLGLATMDEMVRCARDLALAVDVPLLCDADTGYGGLLNIKRTVEAFENADIAGIHIEDQALPKRCGALGGIKVVDREEARMRIDMAVKARMDPDFIIIARTDARDVFGLEEAVLRARIFESAGADAIMVEGLKSLEEIRTVVDNVKIPVLFNIYEVSEEDAYDLEELEAAGVKIAINCLSATLLCARVLKNFYAEFRKTGTTRSYVNHMMPMGEYVEMMGIDQYQSIN